MNDLIGTYN